ncbi:MAG: sigma 54-interacting transcriptional regulator [Deltaproteobacteria bacterium]|nr:sigma 54-interacting transcriptional regulator [Deltaproteobacteria bacterium]
MDPKKQEVMDRQLIGLAMDNPYEGLVVVDHAGIIRYFSKSNEKVFNIKREEAIGKHVTKVIPNTGLHRVIKTGKAEIGDTMLIGGERKIVGRFPIKKNGLTIGAAGKVIFFQTKKFIDMASKVAKLQEEIALYQRNITSFLSAKYTFDHIKGKSKALKNVKDEARRCCNTSSTILITGETGTGKELLAHAIHNLSIRKHQPFVKLNCSAIPPELIESELFGYEEGAFTGARKKGKLGKFELARNGTIFLDEIGEMPLQIQPKLLRVLQEKEIERVGATHPIQLDFRLIVATNKNLASEVRKGRFREDLYYRLNVITLRMPPLRDIKDDIPRLIDHLLNKMAVKLGTDRKKLSKEVENAFLEYNWPGNIRELENIIERAFNITNEEVIPIQNIPSELIKSSFISKKGNLGPKIFEEAIKEAKREIIKSALTYTNNSRVKAANLLGINRSRLYYIMESVGLS